VFRAEIGQFGRRYHRVGRLWCADINQEQTMIEPLVLKERFTLPPDSEPSPSEQYDPECQVWIDMATGRPLIETLRATGGPTPFGETMTTESREGADQSEITALIASQFGETMMTKTQEGHDQTGESPMVSTAGEITNTYRCEEVGTTDLSALVHAAYSHL
jgi:hypothetical protein